MEGGGTEIEPKKKIILLVFLPLLLGLLLYGGGFLAQLLINYKAWQRTGGVLGHNAPKPPDPSLLRCLAASFHWPEGLISMSLILEAVPIAAAGILTVNFSPVFAPKT